MLTPGSRLGPFEIVAALGEGGMGAVYRARDTRLGRDVAIKVIRHDLAVDAERRQRFIQEARAVSALNHPSIVTVHDIGTEGDGLYLVMELVTGRPLSELIPAGGMSIADILRIGSQVADACAVAHARQIVHRDLKPANIMIQEDGRAKVLDFGLAKVVEATPEGQSVTQTAAGTIVGTAAYMSPEQAQGQVVDARTDIFSLGAVLYEIATGRRAFPGDSQASVLASVLKDEPKPSHELRAELPADFARIVHRCLRKDPNRRVQSMADLRAAIDELRDELASGKVLISASSMAPVVVQKSSARPWMMASTAAFAAVIALVAFIWWPRAPSPPANDEQLRPVPLTTYAGNERAGGFSPDGNQIVFSWDGEDRNNSDIYVKLVGPGSPLRLTTDPAADDTPRWSPDGRWIAFLRGRAPMAELILIPALGGAERVVATIYPRVSILPYVDIDWADSKHILIAGGLKRGEASNLHRVNVESGEISTLLTVEEDSNGFFSLDVSPDGKRLAVVRDVSGSEAIEIYAIGPDFKLGPARRRNTAAGDGIDVRWSSDSRDLLFRPTVNNPMPLFRLNSETGATSPMLWLGAGATAPVVSPTGNRLVFTRDARDTNIWRVTLGSRPLAMERIAVSSFREAAPRYSPDGKRIAFHSTRGGTVQIWVANADGSNAVELTSMDPMATTASPAWSPDSKWIVFDSNDGGGYHLYVVASSGGKPRALTTGNSRNFTGSFSLDGKWIYFASDRDGPRAIYRVPFEGGEPQRVGGQSASGPQLSPDGRWLYFVDAEGVSGLWRMPIGGGTPTQLLTDVFRHNYGPTNDGVYFQERPVKTDGITAVKYLDFATKKVTLITTLTGRVDLGLSLSPGAKYLLFTQIDYQGADLMLVEKFK